MIKIIIIEDSEYEINKFKELNKNRKDFQIIAISNSSKEGIELVKKYNPDGIILDLELTNGQGSGFEFIENINKLDLKEQPKIIVTTNVYSDSVYDYLHENKVDFIFYKKKEDYSCEMVINTLILLQDFKNKKINNDSINLKVDNEYKNDKNIINNINKELDLIGVSTHLKGRKYLFDAIYYLLSEESENSTLSITQYLISKHKKVSSTINRAMQNAILHAWRISAIEDLEKYYTAKVNYETGVPTPVEFIYYYVDKIKKIL